MNDREFRIAFERLTGNVPLRWQERLFHQHFVRNDFHRVIDLPTGVGKTMVMAIWLIARAVNPSLPRRLVYVVDPWQEALYQRFIGEKPDGIPTLCNLPTGLGK